LTRHFTATYIEVVRSKRKTWIDNVIERRSGEENGDIEAAMELM